MTTHSKDTTNNQHKFSPNNKHHRAPAIKIASWNINGIYSRDHNKTKDPNFLQNINNHDIIFLMETKCSPTKPVIIPGYYSYDIYRTSLKTAKTDSGGITLLCKDNYKKGIKILTCTSEDYMWVKLDKSFFHLSENLFICAAYDPPPNSTYSSRQLSDPLELIEEDIIQYSKLGNILLVGDLNARTSDAPDYICNDSDRFIPIYDDYSLDESPKKRISQDNQLDTRGKHLLEICIESKLRILNGRCLGDTLGSFTCHTYNGSSVVDYAIASEKICKDILYFHVQKFDGTLSDHCMTTTLIQIKKPLSTQSKEINLNTLQLPQKWSDKVKNIFTANINNTETQNKINQLHTLVNTSDTANLIDSLTTLFVNNLPKKQFKPKPKKCKSTKRTEKWYDKSLHDLRKILQRKAHYISTNPYDKPARLSYYCMLKRYRKLRKAKHKEYNNSLSKKLQTLQYENPRQYWRILSELCNENNETNTSMKISPGEWYDYLYNLKNDNKISSIETEIKNKLKLLECDNIFNELDFQITNKELKSAFKSLKNNKSAGLDGISNEMFKTIDENTINLITKIFNKILLTGDYPQNWNKGYVTTIYKAKSPYDPDNYRCLTINSQFGKLFNRLLNNRLCDFLTKHNIIDKCQIGFQKEKRTEDHIYTLQTLVNKYTKLYKKKIYSCFIDLRKAFDKVWHLGLFYKLKITGVGSKFYNIIKQMYINSEICIKFENRISDFIKQKIGVKQGDNLSSSLFNIYLNDITKEFNDTCTPVAIGNSKIFCLLYADDMVLLSETPFGLQQSLDVVHDYCDKWKLEINHSKSKIMIFEPKKQQCNYNFRIGTETLERVYQYKYLGVMIEYTGNNTSVKTDLYQRSQKAYFKLRKLLNIDTIKPELYLDIFDKTVIPILTYGSSIWGIFNTNTQRYKKNNNPNYLYEELIGEKLHTKLCKLLLGVNQTTSNLASRAELGRFPIMIQILTNVIAYRARLENINEETLVKESFHDDMMLHTYGASTWYTCTEEILKSLNYNNYVLTNFKSTKTLRSKIKSKLQQVYEPYHKELLYNDNRKDPNEKNKLRTYRTFKDNIKYEPYLNLDINKTLIKHYTQYRLSSHKLQIEVARHIKLGKNTTERNKKKLEARKCKICKDYDEDEKHFLMLCPGYNDERAEFLNTIYKLCHNTNTLNPDQLFIWIMTNEDTIIMIKTIKYINDILTKRENIIKNIPN